MHAIHLVLLLVDHCVANATTRAHRQPIVERPPDIEVSCEVSRVFTRVVKTAH